MYGIKMCLMALLNRRYKWNNTHEKRELQVFPRHYRVIVRGQQKSFLRDRYRNNEIVTTCIAFNI
jgi:hypothetical protein